MTLEEGISIYIQRRRSTGLLFTREEETFRAFLKCAGNLPLLDIDFRHVMQFLNRPHNLVNTRRRKHSLLRHFFDYWTAHGEIIELPMPPCQPAEPQKSLPYIFTREELHKLLGMARWLDSRRRKLHYKTLRAALLLLYATGATIDEVLQLVKEDVDLRHGTIRFASTQFMAGRCVPIGKDLVRVLRKYVEWKDRSKIQSAPFLPRIDGRRISRRSLSNCFRRLRRAAGIDGGRGSSRGACLRDLKATFAVHRITSWIRRKDDLNLLLPALGAYMGHAELQSTERYMQMAPLRFQMVLNKLSPQKSGAQWRHDSAFLEFLTNL